MVRNLLLDVVNNWCISDLTLLLISILSFTLTWFTGLLLGLKVLKTKVKKNIILGALILTFISLFIKPFIPGALAFFCTLIPFLLCLKYYSKAKWVITSWVTFLVLLSTAIIPIIISPLLSSNHTISLFLSQNKYSIPISSLMETFGTALVLVFLTIFNIPLIPSQTLLLTSIDFCDIFLFLALCFWCYLSSVEIWKNLMQFSMWLYVIWTISVTAFVAFLIRKINEKRKNQEYQKKIEIAENKIQELTELAIKNQRKSQTKPNISRPELELREKKIIRSVIEGKSNKEIAAELQISKARVDNLLTPIYRKLDVDGRFQLINYFVKNDLLDWIMND